MRTLSWPTGLRTAGLVLAASLSSCRSEAPTMPPREPAPAAAPAASSPPPPEPAGDHLEIVRERLATRGKRLDAELDTLAALEAERRALIPKIEELKRQGPAGVAAIDQFLQTGQDLNLKALI